jgi:pimeloyl-ACP methyl ester carboxylesterase
VTGGHFPLETSAQYERMAKWPRFILASARYTPHLLPFMVKAGFLLARRLGKRKFIHAVFGTSPADIATFEDPEVYEAVISGSEVCVSETHSSHNAFASEVLLQERTDWSHLIEAARDTVPLFCLNGLQDPQVPKETLREFQAKYPWIKFTDYEDCGQVVFFKKWPEIIPMVEKYL